MAGRFSIDAVFKAVDRLSAPVRTMQNRMKRFTQSAERGLKDVDKAADKWLAGMKSLKSAGTALAASLAVTAVALTAAAQPGLEFEQQLANLGATSLQTRAEIADLEKEALRLGAATQFSATEAAAGMEVMAKAGFTNQEILEGIGGMMYAAAAAGEELAATTENVSSVMKGMALDTSQATRVADVLALASVRTNSSIATLGESMSKVSSTARQLGVPLEDTVAMVALLQDVGLDASEAGSATATMLTMLAKPSKEVAAQMKKMGVAFQDSAGNMLAPTKVLEQLVKAGEKAGGNMSQVAFFADLVGMRGQKAAVNLKDLFAAGKVTSLVDELGKAEGTAKKMSDLRMNTATGDLDVLGEAVKGVQIELFTMASGPLREIVQGMTKWVDENKAFIVSGIVESMKWLGANLGTIATWVKRIAIVVGVFTAWSLAVKAATAATALFHAVLMMNPMSLLVMAIVAAIALILAFWPEISAYFAQMWKDLTEIATYLYDALSGAIGGAITAVVSSLTAVWNPVKNVIVGYFEFYVGLWTILIDAIVGIFGPMFKWWLGILGEVIRAYVDGITWLAEQIIAAFQPVLAFYEWLWDAVKFAAQAYFDYVVLFAESAVERVMEVWGALSTFFASLWQDIKLIFWEVMGPVFEAITSAIDKVRGIGRGTISLAGGDDKASPQVVSPQERAAQSISENTTTSTGEVTIRDESGRAAITKKPREGAFGLSLSRTGAV